MPGKNPLEDGPERNKKPESIEDSVHDILSEARADQDRLDKIITKLRGEFVNPNDPAIAEAFERAVKEEQWNDPEFPDTVLKRIRGLQGRN